MKTLLRLLLLVFLLFPLQAFSQQIVTASITLTNAAGTTNHQTLTVNGNTRTWTNNVTSAATQIQTAGTIGTAATNLFLQIATAPYSGLDLGRSSSNVVTLRSSPGQALSVTVFSNWATITYATQALTSATVVRVPYTVEAEPVKTNVSSGLSFWLEYPGNTNSIDHTAPAMSELLGTNNNQSVGGAKVFWNTAGRWGGIVSNSPGISGNVDRLTNGYFSAPILDNPTLTNAVNSILISPILTNGVNYGTALSSPGSGANSQQFAGGTATGSNALVFGQGSIAAAPNSFAAGPYVIIGATFTNSVGLGYHARPNAENQVMIGTNGVNLFVFDDAAIGDQLSVLGRTTMVGPLRVTAGGAVFALPITNAAFFGTNHFPANADISFSRYALTTLANGANVIDVGTNTFVEVSGPSAAFSIDGIASAARRDGKELQILNQTGFDMTMVHQSGTDPVAAQRIVTMTGADRSTTGNGFVTLIYSGSSSRWILKGLEP